MIDFNKHMSEVTVEYITLFLKPARDLKFDKSGRKIKSLTYFIHILFQNREKLVIFHSAENTFNNKF
jgi:hypothetical protein